VAGTDDGQPPRDLQLQDELLLAELAAVLRPETVPPPAVLDAAAALWTWRTVDAELARLEYDSLLDDGPMIVRAGRQPRLLTFTAGRLTVEVEVDDTPRARRLVGQLVPAAAAELELCGATGRWSARADEYGRFVLDLPDRPERLSLQVRLDSGAVVESAPLLL
jgi:hypothetical protein